MSTTSQRIQEGLELRGLKQTDLVEKTGISKGALSSYISGRYTPKQNNIYLIAKALDVSEAWLMGADVSMERIADSPVSLRYRKLIEIYEQLSKSNREKVLTYSKNLLSTPRMEEDLLAAHARTDMEQSSKAVQQDLDLMNDDTKWE